MAKFMETFADLIQTGATLLDVYSRSKQTQTLGDKISTAGTVLQEHEARTRPQRERRDEDFARRLRDEARVKQLIIKIENPGRTDILGRWLYNLATNRPHSHEHLIRALAQLSVDHETETVAYLDFLSSDEMDDVARNTDVVGAHFMLLNETDYLGGKFDLAVDWAIEPFLDYWQHHRAYHRIMRRRISHAARATDHYARTSAAPSVARLNRQLDNFRVNTVENSFLYRAANFLRVR